MKLVTFETNGETNGERHIGALRPGETEIVDFTAAAPSPMFRDMLALIDAGEAGLEAAEGLLRRAPAVVPLAGVRLLAPMPEPRQMRDCLVFEQHVRQARANRYLFGQGTERLDPAKVDVPQAWYEQPVYYKGNRFSVIGTETDVRWPRYAEMLDYELEFGVVIGKRGADISRADAWSHIYGYMIFNDVSARDAQMREMPAGLGPAKGKDFDTGNVLGPWLVTADEIGRPDNLTMVARINNEEWSRGNSGTMHHDFGAIIAHISASETLHPGEFIGSGTVGGGCGLELGRFLKPDDVMELEVSGLGVLRNRIVKAG
ncbi:MAG: fumarylacetoacetate hydrolase family protein [Proteobacteria bacterium]|nr:fumarylacetoacetate hydrolase family protein [Pseudomonadota bacterium]